MGTDPYLADHELDGSLLFPASSAWSAWRRSPPPSPGTPPSP
ncbi:hypothetical protein [Streptomyces clavuligerus]|nr:hypothetical protein [Streptomyces clavuligerus]